MKKIILAAIFLHSIAFAGEVTLDTLLNKIENTSYQREIYKIKEQDSKFKEVFYKKGSYNGITTEGDTGYRDETDKYTFQGKVSYGDFYIHGDKESEENSTFTYGVEKSIKDLIYSKDDSELKKLTINKDVDKIDLRQGIETQKLNLIELYKDYKDNEFEIRFKKSALLTLEREKISLEKSYQLGSIPKIDLDSLNVSYNNIKIEIEKLEQIQKKIKKRFYYDYLIDLEGDELKEIEPGTYDIEKYIGKVGEKDLNKLQLEKSLTKENIKYISYSDKVPEIAVGVERDTDLDENRIFLKFSKSIFYDDVDLSSEKNTLQQQERIYEQKVGERASEQLKILNDYYSLQKDYVVLENKAALERDKYEIKRLENTLGKISYTEVMEAFDTYLELEISKEKAKNSLNAYVYQIMVRSES